MKFLVPTSEWLSSSSSSSSLTAALRKVPPLAPLFLLPTCMYPRRTSARCSARDVCAYQKGTAVAGNIHGVARDVDATWDETLGWLVKGRGAVKANKSEEFVGCSKFGITYGKKTVLDFSAVTSCYFTRGSDPVSTLHSSDFPTDALTGKSLCSQSFGQSNIIKLLGPPIGF